MNRGIQGSILFSATAVAVLIFFAPASTFADDPKKSLAEKQAQHAALEKKTEKLGAEVGKLKSTLVNTSKDIRATEETLSATDRKLQSLRQRKKIYVEQFQDDQKKLGGFVTAAQKLRRTPPPRLFLQDDPLDIAHASTVIKSVIPVLDQRSGLLKKKLAEIDSIESAIDDELGKRARELTSLNKKEEELSRLLQERQALYRQTENERKEQEAQIKKLAAAAKNLDDLMEKMDQIKPGRKPAQLALTPLDRKNAGSPLPNVALPVHGTLHTSFGETDDLGAKSEGITLVSRQGAPVISPLPGTVRFAGPFQKYKQILIIEHQGGYHSLIAGLGRIDTVVGATLAAGEPVGMTETVSTSPQVYYELRQNGKPVNPQKSLITNRKQEKS